MRTNKHLLITNREEIENAFHRNDKLGTNIALPKPRYAKSKLLFKMCDVSSAFVNENKHIVIELENGNIYVVAWSKKLWTLLEDIFLVHDEDWLNLPTKNGSGGSVEEVTNG